jgi:GNAT superfamily N-acetyltransferase
MEFALLGWPAAGETLDLDHEQFAYAGKFVMSGTGKAVAREGDTVVGAIAFDADRTDDAVCRLRYVTVRRDRQGEGVGPRLLRFVADRAGERGFETARIAVNNPFAYEAAARAGFAFTGETTGVAELVMDRPTAGAADRSRASYQAGLERFRARDLSDTEQAFLAARSGTEPPPVVASPT